MHSGSRKHVLDWIERQRFPQELTALLDPSDAVVSPDDRWMPRGNSDDREARLERDGQVLLPGAAPWSVLRDWWLVHNGRANTPNWDLVASCSFGSRTGLVLIEAKAHVEELSNAGKKLKAGVSKRSHENHSRIGSAINEAAGSLSEQFPGVSISRDSHYQLSNRVALSWKLATMGVPTVLVYLGFTGDSMHGASIMDDGHWVTCFKEHTVGVMPTEMLEREIDCGRSSFWILIRSMPVG